MNERSGGDHSRIANHALVPPVGTFEIDPVHAFVGFSAQHLVAGRVRGHFEAVRGTVTVTEDPSASTVEASIEAASITTLNSTRDDDLRSEHYLDVKRYPTVTYRITATCELTADAWLVTGDFDAARRDSPSGVHRASPTRTATPGSPSMRTTPSPATIWDRTTN